jgi:hypothetical protein
LQRKSLLGIVDGLAIEQRIVVGETLSVDLVVLLNGAAQIGFQIVAHRNKTILQTLVDDSMIQKTFAQRADEHGYRNHQELECERFQTAAPGVIIRMMYFHDAFRGNRKKSGLRMMTAYAEHCLLVVAAVRAASGTVDPSHGAALQRTRGPAVGQCR